MSVRRARLVWVLIGLAAVAAGAFAWWHGSATSAVVGLWVEGEPTPEQDRPVSERGAAEVLRRRCAGETASDHHVLSPYAFTRPEAGPEFRFTLARAIPDARIVFRYARERVVVRFDDVGLKEYAGGAKIGVTLRGPRTSHTATATFPSTGGVGVEADQWRVTSLDVGPLEAGAWTMSMTAPAIQDPRLPPLHTLVLDGFWVVAAHEATDLPATTSTGVDRVRCSAGGWFGLELPRGEVGHRPGETRLALRAMRFDGTAPRPQLVLTPADAPSRAAPPLRLIPVQGLGPEHRYDVVVPALPDGAYRLRVSVPGLDGTIETPVNLFGDFLRSIADERGQLRDAAASLENSKDQAALDGRADLRHMVEYVDENCTALGAAGDPQAVAARVRDVLAQSQETMRRLAAGAAPYLDRTGDLRRSALAPDGRTLLPYRVYVPDGYAQVESLPLVVMLRGGGETEDFFPEVDGQVIREHLNRRTWLMVSPRATGWPAGEERVRLLELIEAVRREYPKIDPRRIYAAGHSRGGFAAWELAAEQPGLLRAIACVSGVTDPALAAKLGGAAVLLIHGERDTVVDPQVTRNAAAELARLGFDHEVQLLPVHDHAFSGQADAYFQMIFDFFDRYR
jgi:dienelactone hydrolase